MADRPYNPNDRGNSGGPSGPGNSGPPGPPGPPGGGQGNNGKDRERRTFGDKPRRDPNGPPQGGYKSYGPKPEGKPFVEKRFGQHPKAKPFEKPPAKPGAFAVPSSQTPQPPAKPVEPASADSTDWDSVSKWYDQLVGESGSEYHREVVLPGVMKLLAPKPHQRLLDVACGQGVLCRLLLEKGAEVTGVDAGASLIRMARERSNPAVRYLLNDARTLNECDELKGEQFDAAACVLAIQNIDPIEAVFTGVAHLLKPGGVFVLAAMHPCFRSPRSTSWQWDAEAQVQYRRVDRYLMPRKEPIVMHPGKDARTYTWTFHRPIQAYFKAARAAGLMVDTLEEWESHKVSTSGPRAGAENKIRKEIPMFLAIRAVKPK